MPRKGNRVIELLKESEQTTEVDAWQLRPSILSFLIYFSTFVYTSRSLHNLLSKALLQLIAQ